MGVPCWLLDLNVISARTGLALWPLETGALLLTLWAPPGPAGAGLPGQQCALGPGIPAGLASPPGPRPLPSQQPFRPAGRPRDPTALLPLYSQLQPA